MTTKNSNRFTLYAVFAITAVPLIIAMIMYFNLWGVPQGRTNFGELLLPPEQLQQTQLVDEEGAPWSQQQADKRWLMVYVAGPECAKVCVEATHLLRQINVALGKEAYRVSRIMVSEQAQNDVKMTLDYPALLQLHSQAPEFFVAGQGIYLVDPLGNIMMYYSVEFVGKELLKDLKKLLKTSNIG
jgi:cytochrome oxidase Cu insertion factor (SCO1/SenC/PrrC family)